MPSFRQLALGLVLLALSGCETPRPPTPEVPTRLEGEDWSLRFEAGGGTGYLRLQHYLGDTLAELHHVRLVLGREQRTVLLGLQAAERQDDTMVLRCAPHPDHDIEVHVALEPGGRVHVQVVDVVGLHSEIHEVSLDYLLPELADPDESWLPHQHPDPAQVAGDGSFHAPVAFVRRGECALALLPDRRLLARNRRIPQAIELDLQPLPRLRHGMIAHQPVPGPGGGFRRGAPVAVQGETLRFGHTLRLFHDADRDTGYRVFRDLWQEAAIPAKTSAIPLDRAAREFFGQAVEASWRSLGQGKATTGVFHSNLAMETDGIAGVDAWYTMRQQSLRTAFGALLYGKRTHHPDLVVKAGQCLAHVLRTAPNRGGLLPALFVTDPVKGRHRWFLDSRHDGYADHYHALDVATTGLWMLRLSEHFPEHRPPVLALCRRTARFFRENQLPSGGFPSFFQQDYLAPRRDRLFDDSAETGAVARFLIEYGVAAGDDEALAAAGRALDRIEELLESGQWLDIESTGIAGPLVDPRSGTNRQGTLGLIHCALAATRFAALRPVSRWVQLTDRLLGQLGRYQQVWAPPWIPNARTGGFGAGNFDHRWNDARQGLAAQAFFAGYQLTDDPQWLERGIAALDAAVLAVGQDHQPPWDGVGPAATLHWGRGTACTVAEIARLQLGDGIVDMARRTGHGIDALWIEDYSLTESRLEMQVLTRSRDLATARLRFRNVPGQIQRLTVIVNRREVGTFAADQLERGITVRPAWMPTFTFAPPKELCRDAPWQPRATVDEMADTRPTTWVEVRFGTEAPERLPLFTDEDGVLRALDDYIGHRTLPLGAEIRSRLLFEVAGRTYREPRNGYRISTVSDHWCVDPGEGDEVELVNEHESRVRRFADGSEFGRHTRGAGSFTYRVPIKALANKIDFEMRVAGRLRIRSGEIVLHEDATTSPLARTLVLELADHRMWATGDIPLTFEPVTPDDEIDVAAIRYTASGHVADLEDLGPTRSKRSPVGELRVVVQPVSLLDRALDVDSEALRLAFFGGPDYDTTPQPEPRQTAGSVAQIIDELSGGRTALKGAVLPIQRWDVVSAECDKPDTDLPPEIVQHVRTTHETADAIVIILGRSAELPLPQQRHVRINDRHVPVVFLSVRGNDGSFLSAGAATAAVLSARFGTQALSTPARGNFGSLAMSGSDNHRPPRPAGINLFPTGWADPLFLKREDEANLVISPLEEGRVGFVLDNTLLPGRGELHLEVRTPTDVAPGLLMYWNFDQERPRIRNRAGDECTASILRLSASLSGTETPFVPGSAVDLFRERLRSLPTETPTGERLWGIHDFRMLSTEPRGQGGREAAFDLRYLAADLLAAPPSAWQSDARKRGRKREHTPDAVQHRDGLTWLSLPAGRVHRLRLQSPTAPGLFRLFSQVRGVQGRTEVTLGVGTEPLATTVLDGVTGLRWLQVDQPRDRAAWLEVRNLGTGDAQVVVRNWLRVPRVQAIHRVRPPGLPVVRNARLMDGVVYGEALQMAAPGKKVAHTKSAVVLPAGSAAIRIRAGLPHDAATGAAARLTVRLVDADGTVRARLLDDAPIRRQDSKGLFLAIASLPTTDQDQVAFLQFEWTGDADIQVVDLAVIRH